METLFRWLAGVLAAILEKYSDPQLEAKLDAYKAKVKELEAEEKRVLAEIQSGQRYVAELGATLNEDLEKRRAIEDAIQRSKEATKAKLVELDALPDRDRVRLDL